MSAAKRPRDEGEFEVPVNETGKALFVRNAEGDLVTVLPGAPMPAKALAASEAAKELVAQAIPLLEQFADVATADVARRHLIQLRRFGRYPHRNAALRRVSSQEEVVFMQQSQL